MSLAEDVDSLRQADSMTKERSSAQLRQLLASRPEVVKALGLDVVRTAALSNQDLAKAVGSRFSRTRFGTCRTQDGVRLSVGVCYLQDYRAHDEQMDSRVKDALVSSVRARNLDEVVCEVIVNSLKEVL